MKIFILSGLLSILSVFSCAEITSVKSNEDPSNLDNLPVDLLYEIGFYLDHEFWRLPSLNRKLYAAFVNFPVKSIFKRLIDIPELVADDVAENEKELKYLLPLQKFTDPEHLHQALKYELYYGNMITTLLPHLINYYNRYLDMPPIHFAGEIFINRGMFDVFFLNDAYLFTEYSLMIFLETEFIVSFQKYIFVHPEHIEHVRNFINTDMRVGTKAISIVMDWVYAALSSNMPDTFLTGFPEYLLRALIVESPSACIWTRIFVSRENNREIFERINYLINSLCIGEESDKEYALLLNLVRFGENDPAIIERIQSKKYSGKKLFLLCHCASLSSKMNIFNQFFTEIWLFMISRQTKIDFWNRFWSFSCYDNSPFQMFKILIDFHERLDQLFRQDFYDRSWFLRALSKYCRVSSFELGETDCTIVFKTPKCSTEFGIPETIIIKLELNSLHHLTAAETIFDNTNALEGFIFLYLQKFKYQKYGMNGENLKLVINSETLHYKLREFCLNNGVRFKIEVEEMLKVIDEPTPLLTDYIDIVSCPVSFEIKTTEQLQRLESLLGQSVSNLVPNSCGYFHYRHVFKYLIQTGQKLPENISQEFRELLEIDFPIVKSLNA